MAWSQLLFKCAVCQSAFLPDRHAILCQVCLNWTLRAPAFCSHCGSSECSLESDCSFPWKSWPNALSITSAFVTLGRGMQVFRAWKHSEGSQWGRWLDQQLLGCESPLWRSAEVLIPVGQSRNRSWLLGRNPSVEIAEKLSRKLSLPMKHDALVPPHASVQKGLSRGRRITHQRQWIVKEPVAEKEIILVDDLRTTGRTLRAAGRALVQAGAQGIHYFTLGYRPPVQKSAKPLVQAERWQARIPTQPSKGATSPPEELAAKTPVQAPRQDRSHP
jgi:predicted amidophosphoribosyltransferase